MFWKVLLYFAALFAHQDHHNNSDELYSFGPTPTGPQTLEEEAAARAALHGDKYGGDMVFPDGWNTTDAAIKNEWFRWPKNNGLNVMIPIALDQSVLQYRDKIIQAAQAYPKYTCISFKDWENEDDYIRIFSGNGCWSVIGRNRGAQDLSLGDGCGWVGLIVHELGHAIGLYHEHQRSDRDKYITVNKGNVQPGQEHNFALNDPNNELTFGNAYDYESIMHYGNYAFSKDPNQLPTMVAHNGQRLYEPYEKYGFTQRDVYLINRMYDC